MTDRLIGIRPRITERIMRGYIPGAVAKDPLAAVREESSRYFFAFCAFFLLFA